MNVVIGICVGYMALLVAAFVYKLATSSPKERLKFVKSFKRGKFALIYLAIVPLFYLAFRFKGEEVDGALWLAIKSCIDVVVLKFDYSNASALMHANTFFKAAIEIGFSLVALNAIMFAISLAGELVWEALSLAATRLFSKKTVVVVGDNASSLDILKSLKGTGFRAVLMDEMSQKLRDDALLNRAVACGLSSDDDIAKKLKLLFFGFKKRQVSVIVDLEDDAAALKCAKQLLALVQSSGLKDIPLTDDCGFRAFIFGSNDMSETFLEFEELSWGLIKFVNRHELIAMDLVEKYPLTQFMTEEQLDYSTATVKPDVQLNVFMIGFGKLNETLFLLSVANNQFLTKEEGKLVQKPVSYHIFDRFYPEGKMAQEGDSVYSKSLHHTYARYENFVKRVDQLDYLPFIDVPARFVPHKKDIEDPEFYSEIYAELSNERSYSYIIISYGTDMQNVELARKLKQQIDEWNIKGFVKIFVKVRDSALAGDVQGELDKLGVVQFGSDKETVYNASRILDERILAMAKRKHLLYSIEDQKRAAAKEAQQRREEEKKQSTGEDSGEETAQSVAQDDKANAQQSAGIEEQRSEEQSANAEQNKTEQQDAEQDAEEKRIAAQMDREFEERYEFNARTRWYAQKSFQRNSNVYVCLNLRTKLHLMNFDCKPYSSNPAQRAEQKKQSAAAACEYLRKYQLGDRIEYETAAKNGIKEVVKYSNDALCRDSLRYALATQEHMRWCANMIINGMVPYPLKEIDRTHQSKDLSRRMHANITTMEGLKTYRERMAKLTGCTEEQCDVIRYDYQFMDDIVWLLEKCGLMLFERKPEQAHPSDGEEQIKSSGESEQ